MFPSRPCLLLLASLGASVSVGSGAPTWASETDAEAQRNQMVKTQIEERGVKDRRVLEAMRKVERHRFVPSSQRRFAYRDHPLPIGHRQTISQPYIVAAMTEAAEIRPDHRVLEIGTGSGYQAAILGEIAKEVYTIEIVRPLGQRAKKLLKTLKYENIHVRIGDGYQGWPEKAPFDAILVTAAPPHIPEPLIEQLKVGGRLVMPVGKELQTLIRITKLKEGIRKEELMFVRFVPMTGEAQKKDKEKKKESKQSKQDGAR